MISGIPYNFVLWDFSPIKHTVRLIQYYDIGGRMKDFVISITKETIINELKSEAEIYLLLSEEIYDEIETGTESYTKEHEFGTDGSLISYIITAIVSMGAKSLVKEGVLLTKIALLDWIKKNEISIKKKFKSKNSNKALEILIKYLLK